MSSKERLEELAEILATGICRLQMRQVEQLRQETAKFGFRGSVRPITVRPRDTNAAQRLNSEMPSSIHIQVKS